MGRDLIHDDSSANDIAFKAVIISRGGVEYLGLQVLSCIFCLAEQRDSTYSSSFPVQDEAWREGELTLWSALLSYLSIVIANE